jgi:hypothetical protein
MRLAREFEEKRGVRSDPTDEEATRSRQPSEDING